MGPGTLKYVGLRVIFTHAAVVFRMADAAFLEDRLSSPRLLNDASASVKSNVWGKSLKLENKKENNNRINVTTNRHATNAIPVSGVSCLNVPFSAKTNEPNRFLMHVSDYCYPHSMNKNPAIELTTTKH